MKLPFLEMLLDIAILESSSLRLIMKNYLSNLSLPLKIPKLNAIIEVSPPRLSSSLQTQSGTSKYMYVSIPNRMSGYVNGNARVNRTVSLSLSLSLPLPHFFLRFSVSLSLSHEFL